MWYSNLSYRLLAFINNYGLTLGLTCIVKLTVDIKFIKQKIS